MCEPTDEWPCNFDKSPDLERKGTNLSTVETMRSTETPQKVENEFSFPSESIGVDDDEEVTESKIRAFLDEKVLF